MKPERWPVSTDDPEVWRGWYKLARWRRRRRAQLRAHPCCYLCEAEGLIEEATVVHHKRAHKGNPDLFFDPTNLASVCKPHHDRELQSEEKGGIGWMKPGQDGWPAYRPLGSRGGGGQE